MNTDAPRPETDANWKSAESQTDGWSSISSLATSSFLTVRDDSRRAMPRSADSPSLDGPGVADVRRLRRNLMSSASRPSDGSSTSWSLADGVFIERFDDS